MAHRLHVSDGVNATLATELAASTPPAVEPVKPGTLTKMDIAALRQSDRVCFHTTLGKSVIRCIKEVAKRGPFDETEKEYRIELEASLTDYGKSDDKLSVKDALCFTMEHSAQFSETWQGIAQNLRVGDVVSLHWLRDNNSGVIEACNRHMDELRLRVERNKYHFAFTVDTLLSEDNSARMTRRG